MNTPESIARQRLLENRKRQSRLDVTDKDFETILEVFEPPVADENPLVFCYSDQIDSWIAKNISAVN